MPALPVNWPDPTRGIELLTVGHAVDTLPSAENAL